MAQVALGLVLAVIVSGVRERDAPWLCPRWDTAVYQVGHGLMLSSSPLRTDALQLRLDEARRSLITALNFAVTSVLVANRDRFESRKSFFSTLMYFNTFNKSERQQFKPFAAQQVSFFRSRSAANS